MHNYAFPQRIGILCLVFFAMAFTGHSFPGIPVINDPSLGLFNLQSFSKKRVVRSMSIFADALNDYRSVQTGDWNALATWEKYNGTSWLPITTISQIPKNTNANVITIRNTHTVTMTASVEYDQLVIESGGQLTIASGVTHTLGSGPGTDLIITGTMLNQGSTWTTSGSQWEVTAGGTYIHNTVTSAQSPLIDSIISPGSNFIYRGSSSLSTGIWISGRTFSNLAFESSGGSYSPTYPSGANSAVTVTGTFRVGPSVNWTKGSYTGTLNFNGDILVEGTLSSNSSYAVGIGKVMTLSGTGSAIMTGGALTVNGTLKTGSSTVAGAGNFNLASSGTLEIGSPNGITTSPTALGSIQNTGTRTFNAAATYIYNGTSAQVTGAGLPATVNRLKIDNAAGVSLSDPISVTGTLELANGKLITTAANSLSVGGLATSIAGGSTSSYVSGPLRRSIGPSPPNPLTFPVGKSSFNPFELVSPAVNSGTVIVQAEVFDGNSGGTAGTGLASLNTDRYWSATIISGINDFTGARVRLTDGSVNANSRIGKSSTASGVYESVGGTVVGSTITSDPITTFSSFVIGTQQVTQHQLTVNKTGPGKVTGTGIDCGADCAESYNSGTAVTLTAVPDAGAMFTGWGGACSGTGTCQLTLNSPASVTAAFALIPPPGISAKIVQRNQGASSSSTIASVSDGNYSANTISVSVNGGSSATRNGVTVSNISVDGAGAVTATVAAAADASDAAFTLTALNGALRSAVSTLQVIVTPAACEATSIWAESIKKKASDPDSNDQFASVAISGDTAVVGAPGDLIGRGAVYVFTRSGELWTQQQKLTAGDGTDGDNLGISVSISGDTVIAGAHNAAGAGAAYVFTRSGSVWTQQQKLTSDDGETGDSFGRSVEISGDTAVVGAFVADGAAASNSGAAYVFSRSGNTWGLQQKLSAPDGTDGDRFGNSVAIGGDTIVVGANFGDSGTENSGSAYVYTRSGVVWSQQQKLVASDPGAGDEFGFNVAISGDSVVIGTPSDDGASLQNIGSAYVFVRNGNAWSQQQKLTAANAAAGSQFGFSVSISGETVITGAREANGASGAAYVFARSGVSWTQKQVLSASDGVSGDRFGHSVAVSGKTALAGSVGDDSSTGAAYVFGLTCVIPGPEIEITQNGNLINSGDTYDFGSQPQNTNGTLRQFTITNKGSEPLTISAPFGISGNVTDFTHSGFSSATIQPAGIANFSYSFFPSAQGPRSARIEIDTNDSDEDPFAINFTGTGVPVTGARTLSITKSGNGGGTVTSAPVGINCGSTCSADFADNTEVTLTAVPVTGSKFNGWTGCTQASGNSCTVTLNSSTAITAAFALITIQGNVLSRNAWFGPVFTEDLGIPGVTVLADGSPDVTGTTNADGLYSLSGFGAGAYTVSVSKPDENYQTANGIDVADAALVARYAVGLEPQLTVHQIAAADVSAAAGVTSYDATLIARWVVGLTDTVNRSGKWLFTPASTSHAAITTDLIQSYTALLYGDVNGSYRGSPPNSLFFGDEGTSVRAVVGTAYAQSGSNIVVPFRLENLGTTNVRSYQFDIQYDPSVLTPDSAPADLQETMGQGMSIFYNVPTPGLLKVAVFDVFGVVGDGTYANLRFIAAGAAGTSSQVKVRGFRFNDGQAPAVTTDGAVFVGASGGVRINGRLITVTGQGIRGTEVIITDSNGTRLSTTSSSLGYFEFTALKASESYVLTARSKRYRIAPVTVTPASPVTSIEMIALE